MSEKVLVFANSVLDKLEIPNGFYIEPSNYYLEEILNSDQLHFMEREHAEKNENYRQLIPYCILGYEDIVLTYQRTKKSGESRLRNLKSIGFGGHLNPIDIDSSFGDNVYYAGLHRELDEELIISDPFITNLLGFIRDDSSEVGRVHFGIVHSINLSSDKVKINDEVITNLQFMSLPELSERQDEFETWSQLIIDKITKGV